MLSIDSRKQRQSLRTLIHAAGAGPAHRMPCDVAFGEKILTRRLCQNQMYVLMSHCCCIHFEGEMSRRANFCTKICFASMCCCEAACEYAHSLTILKSCCHFFSAVSLIFSKECCPEACATERASLVLSPRNPAHVGRDHP